MKEKLLLIPGPTPVHPRIINRLSLPTVSHVGPEMVIELKGAVENLKKIVDCSSGEAFIVAGAGTLAMEMAVLNMIGRGEKALIISHGYFGERMVDIFRAFDLEAEVLTAPWGKGVYPEELERKLKQSTYAAVICTHVDTATGTCAPIKEFASLLRHREELLIVDGVCATGGIEEFMDSWGIDVILTAAQKCFGAPPGLAILVASPRAMEKRKALKSIPAYYADLLRWLPIMQDPSKYFSTPCVNEIRAFYEATLIVLEEGLEKRFNRHRQIARAIRVALKELGFSFFTDEAFLAPTLSVVRYPQGIDDKKFRQTLYDKGVVVAGGLGSTAGQVFRMGHMGNISHEQVVYALEAIEKTLISLNFPVMTGTAVEAAQPYLEGKQPS
ncbi:MAG: alanine--glyoxylate aminotransferase family protein [Candidatus Aminicenantes bacterium]|nr:alanine--glyoxylate aminotransferase family protein [Candidatus Aminicenantes bacterium]